MNKDPIRTQNAKKVLKIRTLLETVVYFLSDHLPPRKEVGGRESRGHRVLASESPPTLLCLVTLLIKLELVCGLCKALTTRHQQNQRQYQQLVGRHLPSVRVTLFSLTTSLTKLKYMTRLGIDRTGVQ